MRRPFKAVIRSRRDDGRLVYVKTVAATTEDSLRQIVERWEADGYDVQAYEELALPLEGDSDDHPDT